MTRRRLKLILQIVIPVIILGYLFLTLDAGAIGAHLARTGPLPFISAFVLLCLRNVVGAFRSAILLKSRGLDFSTGELTRHYFIGFFFNLFLPEVVGRDIARGYFLYRSSSGDARTVGSIVAERLIGTAALLIMSVAAVLHAAVTGAAVFENNVITAVFVLFAAATLAIPLVFNAWTESLLERLAPAGKRTLSARTAGFIRDVVSYHRSLSSVAWSFIVSIVFQLIGVAAAFLIARSLGDDTPFLYFFILLPVIWVLGMLPVSVGGLGVREGSFVVLFGAVGMAREMAMAVSILWFVQNIGLGLVGAVLFILDRDPPAAAS